MVRGGRQAFSKYGSSRPPVAGSFNVGVGEIMSVRNAFLDAGMQAYIRATAKKHFWRVKGLMEFDDLVQEGNLCFAKCYARYRKLTIKGFPTSDDRRQFQALVCTSFERHIVSLSRKRTLHREVMQDDDPLQADHRSSARRADVEYDYPIYPLLTDSNPSSEVASIATLIAKAPPELSALFKMVASDAMTLNLLQRKRVDKDRVRLVRAGRAGWKEVLKWETTNEYLCRLVGLDPTRVNLQQQLQAFLFS